MTDSKNSLHHAHYSSFLVHRELDLWPFYTSVNWSLVSVWSYRVVTTLGKSFSPLVFRPTQPCILLGSFHVINVKKLSSLKVLGVYLCIWGQKPGVDWPPIFGVRYPWRNHVFQIWWWLLKGFSISWLSWWSNFAIHHWLWRSSFYHQLLF